MDIEVYQGEDEDALRNIHVGEFTIEGLTPKEGPNQVLCRMRLDLDGILEVTAVEKDTGKTKQVTIADALRAQSPEEIAAGQKRIRELFAARAAGIWGDFEEASEEYGEEPNEPDAIDALNTSMDAETAGLLERSRGLLNRMHADDREEAIDLHERIEEAVQSGELAQLGVASKTLRELLFFVEGQAD